MQTSIAHPQILFIDGLPGSGKSSVAEGRATWLKHSSGHHGCRARALSGVEGDREADAVGKAVRAPQQPSTLSQKAESLTSDALECAGLFTGMSQKFATLATPVDRPGYRNVIALPE